MSNAKHVATHVATPAPIVAPIETPIETPKTKLEQLEQIVETEKAKMTSIATAGDYAKIIEHLGVIQKAEKDVLDEKNAIARHESEIAAKAQRAERLKVREIFVAAVIAEHIAKLAYDVTPEVEIDGTMRKPLDVTDAYNAATASVSEAQLPIDNALLGALASKPKATATPGVIDLTKTKGKTTEEIVTYYKNAMGTEKANHTPANDKRYRKELVEMGYNDGTVGNALIAYRREIGVA